MSPHLKPYYLVLAVTATAGCFLVPNAEWGGLSIVVAACLLVIFIGRENVEDERVDYLKLKAIKYALAASVPALLFFGGDKLPCQKGKCVDSLALRLRYDHLHDADRTRPFSFLALAGRASRIPNVTESAPSAHKEDS